MGHTATKPDKVNIGITKNFRDQNLVICNVIIINIPFTILVIYRTISI
jgi:hypothetical protein